MRKYLSIGVLALFLLVPLYSSVGASSGYVSIESEVVRLTNQVRLQNGLVPLQVDPRLQVAARGHDLEMLAMNYFSHYSPLPQHRDVAARARLAGVSDLAVGENLAFFRGYSSRVLAQEALKGWMKSPGHRANLLRPTYRFIGVGVELRDERAMLAQVFGELPAARPAYY